MSKPGFFFYTGDWHKDTRVLTVEAKGCWIDWLCYLHEFNGSATLPVEAWGRIAGVSEEVARHVLNQLEITGVGDVEWQSDDSKNSKSDFAISKTIAKLSNRKMVRAVQNRQRISELRSIAGKKGIAKRWQKWQPSSSSSLKNHKNDSFSHTSQAPPVEAMQLAQTLSDRIFENAPNRTPPTEAQLKAWAWDAEKIHRIDGHPWPEIEQVLEWSQLDPFWRSNILSMGAFRKQWNKLVAKMSHGPPMAARAQQARQTTAWILNSGLEKK